MRIRRFPVSISSGVIWLAGITVAVIIGCGGGISPLLQLQFANTLVGRGVGGGSQPSTSQPGGTTTISSVCDLDATRRFIRVVVRNEAQQFVRLSMTFVVSAEGSGFVCNDQLSSYFNAGYRRTVLDSSNATTIGCDRVTLLGGNSLLTLRVTDTLAQNVGGGAGLEADVPIAQPPLNGNFNIPLPELIVLGDENPIFICTGNNLCTQRGFVYTDIANNPISFVNASRTQDTVCNANAGTAPEWRLGNPNIADNEIQPFQYPSGATLIISVLDRASNANTGTNQIVWEVLDVNGMVIHRERR